MICTSGQCVVTTGCSVQSLTGASWPDAPLGDGVQKCALDVGGAAGERAGGEETAAAADFVRTARRRGAGEAPAFYSCRWTLGPQRAA